MITKEEMRVYERDGFVVVRQLFSKHEARMLRDHYMMLRAQGAKPGDSAGSDIGQADPLKQFPRMIHMHRWDEISLKWLLDGRLNGCLTAIYGREPYAVQTMLYFKPPGARGQALHQDQAYLKVQPATCIAAWMALDPCDEENGCMQLVPGSHKLPLLCTKPADPKDSIADITVPIPPGMTVAPVVMDEGDVLFFNGWVIHGSYKNRSTTRFRRALIGHYLMGEARQVAKFYKPALRMDGSIIDLEDSAGGGPCGRLVDIDGKAVIELADARVSTVGATE